MTGNELRQWRQRMGWSQEKTAEQMGLSRRQINRLERREDPPVPAHVERLAYLLEREAQCCASSDRGDFEDGKSAQG